MRSLRDLRQSPCGGALWRLSPAQETYVDLGRGYLRKRTRCAHEYNLFGDRAHTHLQDNRKEVGRIKEILLPAEASTHHSAVVLLERFEIGQNRHPDFGTPVLSRPADERRRFVQLDHKVCESRLYSGLYEG